MRIGYLDCFSGVAGDMWVGALLDLGLDVRALEAAVGSLQLPGVGLTAEKVRRGALAATWVRVRVPASASDPGHEPEPEPEPEPESEPGVGPSAAGGASSGEATSGNAERVLEHGSGVRFRSPGAARAPLPLHPHPHSHAHSHAPVQPDPHTNPRLASSSEQHRSAGEPAHPHPRHCRGLDDILFLLRRAELPGEVRDRCEHVFRTIATAEARVHDQPVETIHFHEVGAEDTIVDVVCAVLGSHLLGIDRFYASAVVLGSGTVRCAHGVLPVPAPGTLAILAGAPVVSGGPAGERTTPTGAALLKVLVHEFEPHGLQWIPARAGYGAGTRDDAHWPNVLRLTLGELRHPGSAATLLEISCHLDTATGETLGWLLDALLAQGAADAFAVPVHMKKGRPGWLLSALVEPAWKDRIVRLLLEESSSLGVRLHEVQRAVLERWAETLATPYGPVRFKCARLPSGRVVRRPEEDEVERLAREHRVARAEVLARLAPTGAD